MITLMLNALATIVIADKVGQGHINWVFGIFLCGVLWLNAVAVFKKVFR